jgi:hypothetical protein
MCSARRWNTRYVGKVYEMPMKISLFFQQMKFGLQTLKDHSSCSVEVCHINEARPASYLKLTHQITYIVAHLRGKRQIFLFIVFVLCYSNFARVSSIMATPTSLKTRQAPYMHAHCYQYADSPPCSFGCRILAMSFFFA